MSEESVRAILSEARLCEDATEGVEIQHYGPLFASRYPMGEAAAVALAACSRAAAELHEESSPEKPMPINYEAAAISLQSCAHLRLDGRSPFADGIAGSSPTNGFYECQDGRWISMAGTEPHQRDRILRTLRCEEDAKEIASQVRTWAAPALETAFASADVPAAMVRTAAEWSAHEQGQALESLPVVEVEQVSSESGRDATLRPLSELRVLDLSRVLAGPTCARIFADYGAKVLHLSHPIRPEPSFIFLDTSAGKRDACLNLDAPEGLDTFDELVAEADVVITNIRMSSLARRKLDVTSLLRRHPGLVFVSINCYGHVGPWKDRPGYELMARAATGLDAGEGSIDEPRSVPAMVCDYVTGYLAACGALIALKERAAKGGSWHVRTSLAQTGMWVERLSALYEPTQDRPNLVNGLGTLPERFNGLFESTTTPRGELRALRLPMVRPSGLVRRGSVPEQPCTSPAAWW